MATRYTDHKLLSAGCAVVQANDMDNYADMPRLIQALAGALCEENQSDGKIDGARAPEPTEV
jgi:hypothetical protein